MPYQPNPFVNPHNRGVELPAGCKDLIDVLKMEPGGTGVGSEAGRLSVIVERLAKFFSSNAFLRRFIVSDPRRCVHAHVVARPNGKFVVSGSVNSEISGLKDRLQSCFPGKAAVHLVWGKETVSVEMTADSFEAAAGMLMDLLERGCGVTEEDELVFVRTEKRGLGE
jgi:hypothetical protein